MNKLHKQRAPFTQVPNALLADVNLSLKAKGLYALMYSKPDGWQFYESALVKENKDGKDAVGSALDELVEAGWLRRSGGRADDTGRFTAYDYELLVSRDGLSVAENPLRKNRCGKPATSNTHSNNTDETIVPPVSPKPTKASPRGTNHRIRLSQFLENAPGQPIEPRGEWLDWAVREFGWDRARGVFEWDDFLDYWSGPDAAGGGRKSDWERTWRGHCRRVSGYKGRGPRPAGGATGQGGFKRHDHVAAAVSSVLADKYGVDYQGHGRQPAQSPGETCPFGDGAEAIDAVFVDVGTGNTAGENEPGGVGGSHPDCAGGSAIPLQIE